jgi:hypothetical protein
LAASRASRSHCRVVGLTYLTGLLLIAGGCSKVESAYDLFLVPSDEIGARMQTVALAPVVLQTDVVVLESILERIDSLVAERLSAAGFDVVPSFVYEEIWMRLNEEAGGFFDPYTGERDDELFEAAVNQLKLELQEGFDPDALVYPEIWSVEAPVMYGTANWDGVRQPAYGLRSVATALSLIVIVEDMEGTELYVNGGGLEVAEMWSAALGVMPRPVGDMFREEQTLVAAVDIALNPLVKDRVVKADSGR